MVIRERRSRLGMQYRLQEAEGHRRHGAHLIEGTELQLSKARSLTVKAPLGHRSPRRKWDRSTKRRETGAEGHGQDKNYTRFLYTRAEELGNLEGAVRVK